MMNCPGRRVFGYLCWDLEEAGAVEGALGPAGNPGQRVFGGFYWDLEKKIPQYGSTYIVVHRGDGFPAISGTSVYLRTSKWRIYRNFRHLDVITQSQLIFARNFDLRIKNIFCNSRNNLNFATLIMIQVWFKWFERRQALSCKSTGYLFSTEMNALFFW